MTKTNFFKYANKEGSLDAFLAWSISLLDGDESERQYAKNLLSFVLGDGSLSDEDRIELYPYDSKKKKAESIETQQSFVVGKRKCRSDLIARIKIKEQTHLIIFENKTNTSHHGEQLEDYKTHYNQTSIEYDHKHFIYFKTGLFHDHDAKVGDPWCVIKFEDWFGFLNKQTLNHQIFLQYKEWINHIATERKEKLANYRTGSWKAQTELLKKDHFIQWELISDLRKILLDNKLNNESEFFPAYNDTSSGRPWTQMRIAGQDSRYVTKDEDLFYRLDSRTGGFYLSLRHYKDVKNTKNTELIKVKRERFIRFKDIWDEQINDIKKITGIEFGKVSSGVNESEIFVIFLNENNSLEKIKNSIEYIHNTYVRSLIKADLIKDNYATAYL